MNATHAQALYRRGRALGAAALCLLAGAAAAVEAPLVPQTSSGTYTVTYQRCSGCFMDWLEERVGDTGAWNAVGAGPTSFSSKAPGRYYYRVGYLYMTGYYDHYTEYSAASSVLVASSLPPLSPLETQLTYRYEARRGDIDADGKLDLYVARTSGGASGDGAVDSVLLRQGANGVFTASVPSAAQSNTAKSWAAAAVRILLKDVNADGFADVVLGRVASAVGNSAALDQIVYAPAEPLRQTPRGIRRVDSTFKQFAGDTRSYVRDPDFFIDNAIWRTDQYTYYQTVCAPGGADDPLYSYYGYCFPMPVTIVVVYPDFSSFSRLAVDLWSAESRIESGELGTSAGQNEIEGLLESMAGTDIGGWSKRETIDKQRPIKSSAYLRGVELFTSLLRITEAGAAEPEESGTTGRSADAVYITGRRVIGFLPMHTALEYRGSTISAYDSIDGTFDDGTLISEVDWSRDRPLLMMTLGSVGSTVTPGLYWVRLLGADRRYPDNLPYDAIPSIGKAGYNSNGYSHGIVRATGGVPSIPMNRFIGGEKPVPSSSYQ